MKSFLFALGLAATLAVSAWSYPRYEQAPAQYQESVSEENPNDMAYRFEIFGTLGYSGYTLGDENQFINQLNSASTFAGGKTINSINGGLTGGLGMAFAFSDFFQLGIEYEGLSAGTSGSLAPGENVTISLPASEFGAFLKFTMPLETRWLLSFGLGLYDLQINDDTEKYTFADGTTARNTFYGGTAATKLWVGGEYFFIRHLSLGADAGYRFARITNVTDENGGTWYNLDGSQLTMDYSGPFARVGLHFIF
jgi:opacity protein-like surface antigen